VEGKLEAYGFWESSKAFDLQTRVNRKRWIIKWIDYWKTRSFIDASMLRYAARISSSIWAKHASDAAFASASRRIQRDLRILNWESRLKVTSQHQRRVVSQSRIPTSTNSRVSISIDSRVSTEMESRVLTSLKLVSTLDQHGDRIYKGRILSHTRSMSLLLQLVQQYTGKSNWQLYQFNSTLTNKSELMTSARLSF